MGTIAVAARKAQHPAPGARLLIGSRETPNRPWPSRANQSSAAAAIFGSETKLNPVWPGALVGDFGRDIAMSGDTAVVGSPGSDIDGKSDVGAAYVYARTDAGWVQQQQLLAADGSANDTFGFSVAISGNRIVVSAPARDVGANSNQGAAYVFTLQSGVWVQEAELTQSDGQEGDLFGYGLAISADTIAVGSVYHNDYRGAVYVFERTGSAWTQLAELEAGDFGDFFGFQVEVFEDTLMAGAYFDNAGAGNSQGSVFVFRRSGGQWVLEQNLTASDAAPVDGFGVSLSLALDTVVIGAYAKGGIGTPSFFTGAAYVFSRQGNLWTQQEKLVAVDGKGGDGFGISVGLVDDRILIGSYGADIGANAHHGAAYVFERTSGHWSQTQKIRASDGETSDYFGRSVAFSGTSALVVSGFDDDGATLDQGIVYAYRAGPTLVPSLLVDDVTHIEGNSGVSNAVFTVSLSDIASQPVTVAVSVSGLTASAGSDFESLTSTLTFLPGQTSHTVAVTVLGDTDVELSETFRVTLSDPTHATLSRPFGSGTIQNDDLASRSFVASGGTDAEGCWIQTSPCRSIAAALLQTASDGEVIILNTGDYEGLPLTIEKGIKITASAGTVAFIRRPIIVSAPGGRVVLRGLTLKGGGAGDGVTLNSVAALSLEYVTLDRWNNGIKVSNPAGAHVAINHSVFVANTTGLQMGAGTSNTLSVIGSRVEGNGVGFNLAGGAATIGESHFARNGSAISVAHAQVTIQACALLFNGVGVVALDGASARLGRSTVFGGGIGLSSSGTGLMESNGTSQIRGNGTDVSGGLVTTSEH